MQNNLITGKISIIRQNAFFTCKAIFKPDNFKFICITHRLAALVYSISPIQ